MFWFWLWFIHILGFVDIAKVLIENGANVDARTVNERTALYMAAEYSTSQFWFSNWLNSFFQTQFFFILIHL